MGMLLKLIIILVHIGYDIDSQTTDEIIANWKVEDPESGLSHCEWAVGKAIYRICIRLLYKMSLHFNR